MANTFIEPSFCWVSSKGPRLSQVVIRIQDSSQRSGFCGVIDVAEVGVEL